MLGYCQAPTRLELDRFNRQWHRVCGVVDMPELFVNGIVFEVGEDDKLGEKNNAFIHIRFLMFESLKQMLKQFYLTKKSNHSQKNKRKLRSNQYRDLDLISKK